MVIDPRAVAVSGRFECVSQLMDAAVRQIGDREAYVGGGVRLSFAAWIRAADGLAAALAERGVGRGDIVALHLSPCVDYAIGYAAIARLGAVTTGINSRLGPREIGFIVSRCKPRVVISEGNVDPELWGDAEVLDRAALQGAARGPALGSASPGAAADPVAIIWTSATTGLPKGAWFDHRNLEAAVHSGGVMTHAFDRRISAIPMVHAGYMAKLWEQLAMGITVVLSPSPWSAESMLQTLVEERITVAAGVPTQWAKLLETPGIESADLSSLRIGLVATAPAAPELLERARATIGCPLVVRYSMTECPSMTGTDPLDPPELQCATVGRTQQGMTVDVVDAEGRLLPPGETGRIRVRGACVMRGYWRDPQLTAEVLDPDGTLTSSDLGRWNEDGCLVLAGRASDMYIRGGYNVHPLEVENVLAEHDDVERVAVVGMPADVIGEIGVACVVPRFAGAPPSLEALRAWVGDRLADYKRPDRLVLIDELPLTLLLKVDKAALRARLDD